MCINDWAAEWTLLTFPGDESANVCILIRPKYTRRYRENQDSQIPNHYLPFNYYSLEPGPAVDLSSHAILILT